MSASGPEEVRNENVNLCPEQEWAQEALASVLQVPSPDPPGSPSDCDLSQLALRRQAPCLSSILCLLGGPPHLWTQL